MPPRVVLLALDLGRLPCRNDTDDVVVCAVRMDDDKHSKGSAQAEQNEPIFIPGVVGIVKEASVLVSKDGPGFLECDPMLALILGVLPMVPLELGRRHAPMYVRCRYAVKSRWRSLTQYWVANHPQSNPSSQPKTPRRTLPESGAPRCVPTTSTPIGWKWAANRMPRVTATGSVPRLIIGIISSPR